jgi:hypothetical protein
MLPGFRFLFAAIVLSMSILIFGLGAAALLRAAHEEFASSPPWHATPETVFAQQREATKPVLAMLRVEPPSAVPQASDPIAAVPPPAEPATVASAPVEPERTAALKPEESPLPEAVKPSPETATSAPDVAKSEIPLPAGPSSEAPVQSAIAAAQAETPASVAETKTAAIGDVSPPVNDAVPAEPQQPGAPVSTDPNAATKIATLGGPAITIDRQPSAPPATNYFNPTRRHVRRAPPRHRVVHARAAQAAQAGDPFNQPAVGTRSR